MSAKFKPGDRVVAIVNGYSCKRGTVTVGRITSDDDFQTVENGDRGLFLFDDFVLETVYNSPLFKAMNEN
jgi:S1-C subfamily serine protease